MKKIIIIFLLVFLSICSTTYSYSNKYFSVSASVAPKITYNDETMIYAFALDNGSNIVVTLLPHNAKYANNNFDQSDIDEYAKTLNKTFSNGFNTKTEIKAKNKVNFGKKSYNAIKVDLYLPEYDQFLRQYSTSSDNYVYTVTLGCTDLMHVSELTDIAKTFTINDTITENKSNKDWVARIVSSIIIIIISTYISYARNKKKKSQEETTENIEETNK